MSRIRPRITYANVVGSIALFGVLAGGGAYAASKIGPNDIRRNAVHTRHIKDEVVKARKIAEGAVRTRKIAPSAKGVAVAGAEVNFDGRVRNWFNRLGGEPVVTHPTTGLYVLTFPGFEGRLGTGAIVIATPIGVPGIIYQQNSAPDSVRILTSSRSEGEGAINLTFDLVVMARGPALGSP